MDASARAGGPTPAAHSFKARDRNRRAQSTGMTDVTSAERGDGSAALSRLADIGTMLRRSDIALAVGMTAILVTLILPLPLLLRFRARHPHHLLGPDPDDVAVHPRRLEFSAFPTVLLIAT